MKHICILICYNNVDHIKKCLYPRYENNIMVSPPLFRFAYKGLIQAGENTMKDMKDPTNGVLGYITTFSANPLTDPNKIYFPSEEKKYAYPKVFDVNFTFTVLNEDLIRTQQVGVLNERYFYNYKTHFHTEDEQTKQTNIDSSAGTDSTDEVKSAAVMVVTS